MLAGMASCWESLIAGGQQRPTEGPLRHWLELEANIQTAIEWAYQTACKRWAPDGSLMETTELAKRLIVYVD